MHGFRGPGTIYYTIDKQLTRHFRRTNLMASLYKVEISRFQFCAYQTLGANEKSETRERFRFTRPIERAKATYVGILFVGNLGSQRNMLMVTMIKL